MTQLSTCVRLWVWCPDLQSKKHWSSLLGAGTRAENDAGGDDDHDDGNDERKNRKKSK